MNFSKNRIKKFPLAAMAVAVSMLAGCGNDDSLDTGFLPPGDVVPAPFTAPANGNGLVVLTADNSLVVTLSNAPGADTDPKPISGITAGEKLVSVDYRPKDGSLYGISDAGQLYRIDVATAVATKVGSPVTPALTGTISMDFNPTVDRIRVVTSDEQNIRLRPDTGALAGSDTALTPAGNVVSAAYTNSFNGVPASQTTLYVVDSASDSLLMQGGVNSAPSPNAGVLTTVGALGVDIGSVTGFDVDPYSGIAYLASRVTTAGVTKTELYTVNLATGAATFKGTMGDGTTLIADVAIAPPTDVAGFGMVGNNLVKFPLSIVTTATNLVATTVGTVMYDQDRDPDTPATAIPADDGIVGIDFRPAAISTNGQLLALSAKGCVYTVSLGTEAAPEVVATPFDLDSKTTGVQCAINTMVDDDGDAATPTVALGPALNGTAFGFDFNPTVDRIRLVSDAQQNLRLNPTDGKVVDAMPDDDTKPASKGVQVDTNLSVAGVSSAAYTNHYPLAFQSAPAPSQTSMYVLNSTTDELALQGSINATPNSPNGGVQTTVGMLGLDVSNVGGFSIVGGNARIAGTAYVNAVAFAVVAPTASATQSELHYVNLETGVSTKIGNITDSANAALLVKASTVRMKR